MSNPSPTPAHVPAAVPDGNGELVAVIDATVVEDPPALPGRQLVRRERRSEVLRPLDADALADSFRQYQELLPRLLEPSDYQQTGDRRFVKKSGWRKIATAFDLDVILVCDAVERDQQDRAVRAKVIARAIAPSGRTMDGDGYCSITETRFQSARADLSKLENDLRATATTRAKNRAIADLVGMGDVSAEEIADPGAPDPLPYGPELDDQIARSAGSAIVQILNGDPQAAIALWKTIRNRLGGYMPQAVALALCEIAAALPDPRDVVVGPDRTSHNDGRREPAGTQPSANGNGAVSVNGAEPDVA